MKEWKKVFRAKWKPKENKGSHTFVRQNEDKSKTVTRNESHYIIIKGSTHQQDTIIISFHDPSIVVPKYIRQRSEGRNRQ